MSFSRVELFNLALSSCGVDLGIASPDEQSREADLCRTWFSFVRDRTIAAAPWPSVRRYARLAQLDERDFDELWVPSNPSPEWRFAYAVPSDLIHPYYLHTYERFEYAGRVVSTNSEQPILYYNARVEDLALWDQGLRDAAMHMLAAAIARPLTGNNTIVQQNYELAQIAVQDAQVAAANINDESVEDLPDWLAVRGTTLRAPVKFFYPFQNISSEKLL